VPCCMSFNSTFKIENINECSLEEIKDSEKFKSFRRRIWEGNNAGDICDNCMQINMKFVHDKLSRSMMEPLKKYCLDGWNV